jgi:RNA polymerase sigma-70 factor (ECF subfamily)
VSTSPVTAAVSLQPLTLADSMDQRPAIGREEPHVQALVGAARTGDRAAFGQLVDLYGSTVVRTARAALGSREDAEDAAQDAFVVAWQKLPDFRGDATFKTWLLTIVWRKALDRRRTRQSWWSRLRSGAADGDADVLDGLTTAAPDPEQDVLSRDLARRIRAAIRGLTPKLRDTFLLASSGEHTYEEIATLQGIPVGTVKWRVSEARRIIQERLQ